jgi:hypothetical protein
VGCGIYDDFLLVSAPSNGEGCGITDVFAEASSAGLSFTTFFAPLCDGIYGPLTVGLSLAPGQTGTWTWSGENYSDGENTVTLNGFEHSKRRSGCASWPWRARNDT